MGFVSVKGLIGRSQEAAQEVEFLVDTGSRYTVISPDLARDLSIPPTVVTQAILANSSRVDMGTAMAYLKLLDREGAVPVGMLEVPVPLLGVTALELLGLRVDPVREVIEYSWPFGPAVLLDF
jgi:predicted aspartyl protease